MNSDILKNRDTPPCSKFSWFFSNASTKDISGKSRFRMLNPSDELLKAISFKFKIKIKSLLQQIPEGLHLEKNKVFVGLGSCNKLHTDS